MSVLLVFDIIDHHSAAIKQERKMGIWLLLYSVENANHDRYLDWFHNTHIDEKLSRPGYHWAAHYRIHAVDNRYIALFGSNNSRTFFDPSPKQLKPKQDSLTREMISYRIKPLSLICTCEWSNATETTHAIKSSYLTLILFDDDTDDQDVMAWCAQQHSPALESESIVHQFLTSSGAPRHLSIVESTGAFEAAAVTDDQSAPAYHRLVAEQLLFRDSH